MSKYFLASLFVVGALSKQPEAQRPTAYPSRSLQWGKLNFLHTTDTHSWLAGHIEEPQYSADWGDYISFTQRMREKADNLGVDLLVVDTGDRIEGNGLYDASTPKGKYLYDIFNQQKIDILNSGNHELYQIDSVHSEVSSVVPHANGNYIASNLDYIDPQTGKQIPLARRYRTFTTKNQGIKITAFGFIFNFNKNANNSVVQRVEDTVKEEWFQKAIRDDVDVFVVATHAPLNSPEHWTIHDAIRSQNKDTPIQFFGAHSHVRNFKKYDSRSYGIQSGRYMETIGWASIDWNKNATNPRAVDEISFNRRYIDANVEGYQYHSGLNNSAFHTGQGKNVSALIDQARKSMDLNQILGCVPRDLFYRASYPSRKSLLTWLAQEMLPDAVARPDRANISKIIALNSGFIRYDLLKGAYTRDTTYNIAPFQNNPVYIKNFPYESAKNIVDLLNRKDPNAAVSPESGHQKVPRAPVSDPEIVDDRKYLENREQQPFSRGYVTSDDAGSDGDDTLHSPVISFPVPDYISSEIISGTEEPKEVDLIFTNFMEPYVVAAIRTSGQNGTFNSIETYTQATVGELMNEWVQKNWPCS